MTNSRYRWVIVAAGGLLGCVAIGGMFSLPVFLQPIARDTGWSVTGISSAMTIGFLAMACTSMIWGTLSDRLGPLPVVLTGSVVLAASLGLASLATSLVAFQFVFGLMVGGSIAAIFAPMMACVTGWFDTHRSLAVSLVSAGMGMAPMTMAPLAAWLVANHDWRTSMQIVALVVAVIMIPVSLLVRRAPALVERGVRAVRRAGASRDVAGAGASLAAIHHPAADEFFLLRHAFGADHPHRELRHQLRHPVDRGGHDLQRGGPGRDRRPYRLRPARRPLRRQAGAGFGLLAQAFGALGYVFVRDLAAFYTVAALFGFIYAGTMPLYAVLVRENFPLRMMGTVIGGTAMAGSLGMATGPLAGGLIYDTFASYAWLYIGSWVMGIGAFLIMMTFRPVPAARTAPVPA